MENRAAAILSGIAKTHRIAHAYLFLGGSAPDKISSALHFAKLVNCLETHAPCNTCTHCRRIISGTHPDILILGKDKKSFKLDQVRQLKELTHFGPTEGNYKLVIINDADTMTDEAANGLLKALEEPPENVIFILISNREEGLLPTIISRCQKIVFPETSITEPSNEITDLFQSLTRNPANVVANADLLGQFENPENMLEELFTLYAKGSDAPGARYILNALKNIKRGANKKLALDWMCLNLWKRN